MNEQISRIIEELKALDPQFGQYPDELEKILLSLLAVRPDPKVDPEFVRTLKSQLLQKLSRQKAAGFWHGLFTKKLAWSAAALALVVVAAVAALGIYSSKKQSSALSFGSDVRVVHTVDGAFGNLATLTAASSGAQGTSNALSMPESDIQVNSGVGVSSAPSKLIAPYQPVNYKYVYKGDSLNLPSSKLDVLKKQSPDSTALTQSLSTLGLGLLDLNSFSGSKIQSVNFSQDNGYNLYVDLNSGTVSISGGFYAVPLASDSVVSQLCTQSGCPGPAPISQSDIPDDATLISIANQFLSDHGIATSIYGAPEVDDRFGVQNETIMGANPKTQIFWPDNVSIVYPFKVGDSEVYDESGSKTGLLVDVDVRNRKVSNVSNLSTQEYQASSYDAETDADAIIKSAESGGMYGNFGGSEGAKTVELDLGTPVQSFVQMWDYQMNSSQELLVPALIFPITNAPTDGSFYQKAVVVPLISDILKENSGPVKILNGNSGSGISVPPIAPAK
ncbi:MAG TPA: hypothetical protein VFX17_01205 [Patescibacteria group bacterium]|nr:hypothetical protein [Patescibacteria group bacterium]